MMNSQKIHPVVKSTYIFRIVGCLFWGIVLISLSYEKLYFPKITWFFLFVYAIVWPHVAYLIAAKNKNSRDFEIGNQLIDAFLVGIWLPIIQFSIWPTFTAILVIGMNNMSVRGYRLMLSGMMLMLMGGILSSFFYGIQFFSTSGIITTVLSACLIFIYVISLANRFYRYGISKALAKKQVKLKNQQLQNLSKKLSEFLPSQLVDNIADGQLESVSTHHRKKLTFFFSDIKDFTMITDALEPEDMAIIINEYLAEMTEIINKYQGTLAQVIGDGLYVFFGAPKSTNDSDHAIRCLKMAIDMQLKMKELNKKWIKVGVDEELQIRCGINTGMATVGGYGSSERKEYTAMGMQVNIAARLESACKPGHILINHSTWVLVKEDIPCAEMGKIEVKGYHLPIKVYEVETS